jgi:hypothetical protein
MIITASIDVNKIDRAKLIKGKKGIYLNMVLWVNEETDQYGNNVSVEQKTAKGEPKIYLGNGKTHDAKQKSKEPDFAI